MNIKKLSFVFVLGFLILFPFTTKAITKNELKVQINSLRQEITNLKSQLMAQVGSSIPVLSLVPSAPTITTTKATFLFGPTEATLNGTYNDNGSPINKVWFKYGTTSSLGTTDSNYLKTGATLTGSGVIGKTLNVFVAGKTYFFKVCGQNSIGSTCGKVLSFTQPVPPAVTHKHLINHVWKYKPLNLYNNAGVNEVSGKIDCSTIGPDYVVLGGGYTLNLSQTSRDITVTTNGPTGPSIYNVGMDDFNSVVTSGTVFATCAQLENAIGSNEPHF